MSFEYALKIERVSNGYVLTSNEADEYGQEYQEKVLIEDVEVVEDAEREQRTMARLLQAVQEHFGVFNSKHNKTRLNIEVVPQ